MAVKFKVVEHNKYTTIGHDVDSFEKLLNDAILEIEENDGHMTDIKYSAHSSGSSNMHTHHSAIIIYNEVPRRKVLTEKYD